LLFFEVILLSLLSYAAVTFHLNVYQNVISE